MSYSIKNLIIDRNENSKIKSNISIICGDEESKYYGRTICSLPKKLDFSDKQIKELVMKMNSSYSQGYEKGLFDKTNELRRCLGSKELEDY